MYWRSWPYGLDASHLLAALLQSVVFLFVILSVATKGCSWGLLHFTSCTKRFFAYCNEEAIQWHEMWTTRPNSQLYSVMTVIVLGNEGELGFLGTFKGSVSLSIIIYKWLLWHEEHLHFFFLCIITPLWWNTSNYLWDLTWWSISPYSTCSSCLII